MINSKRNIQFITYTAIGIALYVALSLAMNIPIIGHASLDLGYIVLAIYCYQFGSLSGAIVGGVGCMFVSLLTSGWFPPGWILGNLIIGTFVGKLNKNDKYQWALHWRILAIVLAVFVGIFIVKTAVECAIYSIPLAVKLPKSAIVFIMDSIVMSIGTWIAPKFNKILKIK